MANPSTTHSSTSKVKPVRLALVGGDTLLGRDLKEVLEARNPLAHLTPFAANAEGNFGEEQGEAVYVHALTSESIANEDAIVITGSEEGAVKALTLTQQADEHPLLIDCVGHLENQPEAMIVAPLLEPVSIDPAGIYIVAHPAATALALVLTRLSRKARLRQVVVQIFEPASERGKLGITELQQQTSGLLAFRPLEKKVFDAQLSFNLLPQYGEEAPLSLAIVEQRIERHVASLLSKQVSDGSLPMPSIRVVQAPVFHGYSLSLWIEFESRLTPTEVAEALASAQIEIRSADQDAPNNVGVAGESGLVAGDIRPDRNNPRAIWLWIAADNLRVVADGAVDLLLSFGRGAA